ncbi:MAG: Methyl-accepting chemotaxis protein [Ktedonobacterales bacterium]|jgi:methyl-accepting chemotaxis protein|nr:MAG: Methyl-accepting chemotaxis protein [Ktedonobacterales bacterium]
MDPNSHAERALGARLNWLLIVATALPALLLFALGIVATRAGDITSALPPETLLWGATFGLALLAALAVAGLSLRMRAVVRTYTLEVAETCRQAVSGDRSVRLPVAGEDEFAVLASAVNGLIETAPGAPGGGMGESQDAATLQAQIEKLLQEVSSVGDGDLRVQAEVTPDTLGVLADSFNYMIEELAKVVGRVQATTFQVTNATRRLLDRSAEVADASQTQAHQISQTTQAVAQLADFVQLSASNAISAAEAARETLRNAEGGQQAVVQTIDGMVHIRENVQETSKKIKRLGERSQEVGEIVRLIEDIADQTNLLALNAAIQSAMAGEHGRGFAVVAEEIRMLAERVTEATKRIATLVKGIQGDTYEAVVAMEESTQEVVNGSRLADEAGEALRSIYTGVDRQAQMIEDIARAANERAQTSEAVAAAMARIADITRQTNTATQDTTAAVSYLAELAEQLRASVATFRLPEQATQGQALLPRPEEAPIPMMSLPNLGPAGWGNETASPYPALPPAPANVISATPGPDSMEFGGGYDSYYGDQQFNGNQYNGAGYTGGGYSSDQYNGGGYTGGGYNSDQYSGNGNQYSGGYNDGGYTGVPSPQPTTEYPSYGDGQPGGPPFPPERY